VRVVARAGDLIQMVRRRGTAARRIAENLQPIELVIDDTHRGRQRLVGHLESPQLRFGELREIGFSVRELQRAP
jgi:hypothetical protein